MGQHCNYELLDCGNFEKLERFGNLIFRRPALQAFWKKKLSKDVWNNFDAMFDQESNKWIKKTEAEISNFECHNLSFELRYSPNRQIGIFPEQLPNWKLIQKIVSNSKRPLNILNGFAYTGASTLFSSSENTKVTHIDASSSSVNWAKKNCILSNKDNNQIRWIVDDILLFMKREVKREIVYDGIILDPPAFGRGKKGAVWKIKRDLPKLIQLIEQLLSDDPQFIVLSCHDKDFENDELLQEIMCIKKLNHNNSELIDLIIKSKNGNDLPAGKCVRWQKV